MPDVNLQKQHHDTSTKGEEQSLPDPFNFPDEAVISAEGAMTKA